MITTNCTRIDKIMHLETFKIVLGNVRGQIVDLD